MQANNNYDSSKKAFLVGPFIGELSWEIYRFAPYIIHLKKENPLSKIVVLTRPQRFDLYGQYASILVALNLPKDLEERKLSGFSIENFEVEEYYRLLISAFFKKYNNKFKNKEIIRIYPEIVSYLSKLKWQFPRSLMDYDFKPRRKNLEIIEEYITNTKNIFINSNYNSKVYSTLQQNNITPIFLNDFSNMVGKIEGSDFSFLGCLIELIRKCKFVVTNFGSYISNLSLLIGTPILIIEDKPSADSLHILNPKGTLALYNDTLESGIKMLLKGDYFENNI